MSATPQRIQLSRRAGFNLQAVSLALNGIPAVNCARPSRWGNHWKVGRDGNASECVRQHRNHMEGLILLGQVWTQKIAKLRGKNLACWCSIWKCRNGHNHGHEIPQGRVAKHCPTCGAILERVPCHCDTLLEIANA